MLLAAMLLFMSGHSEPQVIRWDRLAFSRAIAKLDPYRRAPVGTKSEKPPRRTRSDVKRLLGPPGEVRRPRDDEGAVMVNEKGVVIKNPYETWCYGTNGPRTMATLGSVTFDNGILCDVVGAYGEPPSSKTISDAELVAALRVMYRRPTNFDIEADPHRYIQSANMLITKGKTKALAILREYNRLSDFGFDSTWLFWLVRVAFQLKHTEESFPVPYIGAISPTPPDNPRDWPTYPVEIVDGVPYCLVTGIMLSGVPESFDGYLRRSEKGLIIRTTPLIPPNDPFPTYAKLLKSKVWTSAATSGHFLAELTTDMAFRQLLSLVSGVYKPKRGGLGPYFNSRNFDKLHQEFLALGCHWDQASQSYVR